MKFVGKPYEGKLHVRFEEGEWLGYFGHSLLYNHDRPRLQTALVRGWLVLHTRFVVCIGKMQL